MTAKVIPMETWEKHLSSVLQARDTRPPETHGFTHEAVLFTEEEIAHTIKNTKNHKANGPDNIYNDHLKTTLPVLVNPITILLNECLRQGVVPTNWKKNPQ